MLNALARFILNHETLRKAVTEADKADAVRENNVWPFGKTDVGTLTFPKADIADLISRGRTKDAEVAAAGVRRRGIAAEDAAIDELQRWRMMAQFTHVGTFGVTWQFDGAIHRITYGIQVTDYRDAIQACHGYGECIHHALSCAGKFYPENDT